MTRVELTEATAPLAAYARKARRGPVVLTRRGRPVAMLRLLTEEEREDYLVSTDPGFVDLIRRSREAWPPGSGIPLADVKREGGRTRLVGRTSRASALRDYINATIGFEKLSRLTGRPAKSLMRMLGPRGNPQARNLFEVIGQLQRTEGLHFEVSLRAAS